MTTTRREAPHHRTLYCVKHFDCQLPACRERHKAYMRDRYHQRKQGTWLPLVDAEPVRLHLLALYEADFTPVRVSTITGLPFETIVGFTRAHGTANERRGRKRRCTPEVAEKILAVTAVTATPGRADATGTQRRIQALVAAGWPLDSLGPQIGLSARCASSVLNQARVYGRTVEAFAELYTRLAGKRPEKHGISRTSAKRARVHAERRRWAPPSYWAERMDVIDDPHFEPMYGVTRREIVAQDAGWLMRTSGLDRATAAARLGISKAYIDHAFRDHPEYALDVAA